MTFHGYAGANGIERGVERVQGQVVPKHWVQTAFHGGESEMACNGRVCVGGRTSQARNKRRRGPYLKQNTRPRDVSAKRKGFMENWGIS